MLIFNKRGNTIVAIAFAGYASIPSPKLAKWHPGVFAGFTSIYSLSWPHGTMSLCRFYFYCFPNSWTNGSPES